VDVRHNVSIVPTFRDWRFCSVRGCFDKKFGNNSVRFGDVPSSAMVPKMWSSK
jgi:hypothetical protein